MPSPRSMKKSLGIYRHRFPGKLVFDLSQDAKSNRGRTDLRNGELPTLATSSSYLWLHDCRFEYIWICLFKPLLPWKLVPIPYACSSRSENLKRCFSGREKLFSLGYPVWGPACAAGRVESALANLISFYNLGYIYSEAGLMCSYLLGLAFWVGTHGT